MSDTEKNIKLSVVNILSDYTQAELSDISCDSALTDLGIDSVSLVEIIFDLEEHFDIIIPEEKELETQGYSFACIADITTLVSALTEV